MSDRDTFGPRLRRERERRGITLETIAAVTKVGVDLWEGLERNDFSRWPSGIFARAFIRDYARAVGLDGDEVVDEFCRLFPVGDRRASRIIKAQAELIGHAVAPIEAAEVPPQGDRRATANDRADAARERWTRIAPRVAAAAIDAACVLSLGGGCSMLVGAGFWSATGVLSILYYSLAMGTTGSTPGTRVISLLRQRLPDLFTRRAHA